MDFFDNPRASRYTTGNVGRFARHRNAEDKQEDMQVDIESAIRFDKEIRVTYHDGRHLDTVVGRISSVNHQQRRLEMLVSEEYGLVHIPYNKLVDTELI